MNNNLVLDNGEFIENIIYLTFAEDVLSHKFQDTQINEQFLINVYFPMLINHQVSSGSQLIEQRNKIFNETKKMMTEATENTFKKEDMLYAIIMDLCLKARKSHKKRVLEQISKQLKTEKIK